jgi:hypothetical protein
MDCTSPVSSCWVEVTAKGKETTTAKPSERVAHPMWSDEEPEGERGRNSMAKMKAVQATRESSKSGLAMFEQEFGREN